MKRSRRPVDHHRPSAKLGTRPGQTSRPGQWAGGGRRNHQGAGAPPRSYIALAVPADTGLHRPRGAPRTTTTAGTAAACRGCFTKCDAPLEGGYGGGVARRRRRRAPCRNRVRQWPPRALPPRPPPRRPTPPSAPPPRRPTPPSARPPRSSAHLSAPAATTFLEPRAQRQKELRRRQSHSRHNAVTPLVVTPSER